MKTQFDILDRRAQLSIAAASAIVITAAVLGVMRISASHAEVPHVLPANVVQDAPMLLETVVVHASMPQTPILAVTQLPVVIVHAHAPVRVSVAHHSPRKHKALGKTLLHASRPVASAMSYHSFGATMTR